MAPSATDDSYLQSGDLVQQLRHALSDEALPLSQRFRALFALKHHACVTPPTASTLSAIEAIASAFATPSALLKHEVAYCLGQTKNMATAPHLKGVLKNSGEDPMVRHEAAEAIGALGDLDSIPLLEARRDDSSEPDVVRETCEIAVERILWENGEARHTENLKHRYWQLFVADLVTDVLTAYTQ